MKEENTTQERNEKSLSLTIKGILILFPSYIHTENASNLWFTQVPGAMGRGRKSEVKRVYLLYGKE